MTIAQRIDDAEFLWQANRRDGAFLAVLVAFAATARRVRPRSIEPSDAKSFKALFREQQLPARLSVRFRGEMVSMDEFFYKWLRCELVHEGGLPIGITFDTEDNGGLVTIRLSDDLPITISSVWYHSLVLAVLSHPANADVFPMQEVRVDEVLRAHEVSGQRLIGKDAAGLKYPGAPWIPPDESGGISLSKEI